MSANYTPNQNEYKNLTPFKSWLMLQINTWGQNNFPFVESDFDELTNYGMLMKMMNALNDVISNENKVEQDMTNLFNAFTELQTYVNDYFDNLDVQDEINAKLDEMTLNGTLTNLIKNYVDPIYQNYENSINATIQEQNTKINSIYNIKPIVVSSTSQMTDTTKTYLLTTDGNWYYYNGTTWVIGGSYQGIVLDNNAVSYVNLDTYLQTNFNTSYSTPLESPSYAGFGKIVNGEFRLDTNSDYQYEIYSLELGKTYQFNVNNLYSMCGLLIVDGSNNVIYNSNPAGNQTDKIDIIMQIKQNNLTAYISHKIDQDVVTNRRYYVKSIRELNNISNNLKIDTNIVLLETIEGRDMRGADWQLGSNTDSNVLVYAMDKGKTYHIKAYNQYSVNGYVVMDGSMTTQLYTSYQTPSPSAKTLKEITFTPTTDGFIFVSTYAGTPVVEIIIDAINENSVSNNLYNKKVLFYGDSITANSGSWADGNTIASKNNMTSINYAVGGMTFSVIPDTSDTQLTNILLRIQNTLSGNFPDYIILQGGVNDAFRGNPLGTMSNFNDFTGSLDTSTFSGSFESAIRYILTNAPGCKLGFILNNNIPKLTTLWNYMERAKQICEKYCVPVLDLYHESGLCAGIPLINNEYYEHNEPDTTIGDQTHPTPIAYDKYLNSKVEEFMNRL